MYIYYLIMMVILFCPAFLNIMYEIVITIYYIRRIIYQEH